MRSLLVPLVNFGLLNLINTLYRCMYLTKDMIMSIVERMWFISNRMSMCFWISSMIFLSNDSDWKINIYSVSLSLLFKEDSIWVEKVTILPLLEIWTKFCSSLWVKLCKSTVSWTLKKYPLLSLNIRWISSWTFLFTSLKYYFIV